MAVVESAGFPNLKFAIEFHQYIRVANIFVTITHSKYVNVLVTKRYIQFSTFNSMNKVKDWRFKMEADTFLPASTCGLSGQYLKPVGTDCDQATFETLPKNDPSPLELTFRIHINDEVFPLRNDSFKFNYDPPVQIQTEYVLLCKKCHKQLNYDPLVFKRVLEKPSSDWQDLASEWFCHRHGEDCDELPAGIKTTDLMFCENRIFLHPSLINLKKTENGSSLCNRCDSHLGFMTESRLFNETNRTVLAELIMHSILIKSVDYKDHIEDEESESAIDTVVKLIAAQMEPVMMCKLCLESKGPSKSGGSLLLWVMDNVLQRFHTQCTPSVGVRSVLIKPEKVIRVLYSLTESDSPLAGKWRKDFSVETQIVEDRTLWSVVDHLLDSTKTLPSAHRLLDDLWIGFLPGLEQQTTG